MVRLQVDIKMESEKNFKVRICVKTFVNNNKKDDYDDDAINISHHTCIDIITTTQQFSIKSVQSLKYSTSIASLH